MGHLGTQGNPLRTAIVGSGPAGFYTAEALLRSKSTVVVDMFERLASPFGLVRSGVAPDHPKLKEPIRVYEKIAESPQFRFLGNITVGRDVSVRELRDCYHTVVLACGAQTDRTMGIPGEHLAGSHAASEFVGWYNGHPDYRDRKFDLFHETAVVIGQGNVAIDIARVLAKTVDELRRTDIAAHALEVLAESKIRNIHIIGRRGPVQAKFTHPNLREMGQLADCEPVVNPSDLELNAASREELADRKNRATVKSYEVLQGFAARPTTARHRRCHIDFFKSPVELGGGGRLERVVLMRNRLAGEPSRQVAVETGKTQELACGILIRSIGYRSVPITGVPFDDVRAVIPNRDGRVTDGTNIIPGLYVAGWIKRGPTGIIGSNREDSVETVNAILADLPHLDMYPSFGTERLEALLERRGIRVVSFADWQKIDAAEMRRGKVAGKPREKFTRLDDMLDAATAHQL